MKGSTPVLAIDGVTKLFGSKAAVNELSLSIHRGEIFGFLGPNGAGKTTTIRVILDILRPSRGSVSLFGLDSRQTAKTHRRIGYLSGDMVLDGDVTGRQYLNFVDKQYGGRNKKRMDELSELVHIELDSKIDSYSRGNKQKIALIAALMHGPELLIMDEPTNGFDPLVQETFMNLIKQYQSDGGTVFMSSHILSEVQRLCSHVGFIKDGSLVGVRTIEQLHANAAKTIKLSAGSTEISKIKSSYRKLKGLKLQQSAKASATLSYSGDMQSLLKFFAGYKLSDITIVEPELEEVFLEYYTHKGVAR
jgi:ABC-2 type transport system ATP-binding protein